MRYLNLILIAVFSLILSYFLPIFINLLLPQSYVLERVRYSPVIEDFMLSRNFRDEKRTTFEVIGKAEISEDEFIQNQPFSNYALLIQKGTFPQKFQMYADNPRSIRTNSQFLNLKYGSNKTKYIPLNVLLYTDEKYGRLSFMPTLIRLEGENGLELIDMESNEIDVKMTDELNKGLKDNGFIFPAKRYFTNPSTLKAFDEGAFIVDKEDNIFHLKRENEEFTIKNTGLNKKGIININISEDPRREFYALLVSQNELGLISYDGYKFIPLNNEGYDPMSVNLNLRVTPVNKILTFLNRDKVITRVMDLNYAELKQNTTELTPPSSKRYMKSYFLPFETTLVQESYFYKFKFENFSLKAIWLSIVLAFAFFIYNLKFKKSFRPIESILIVVFGIYGFIANIFYDTKRIN